MTGPAAGETRPLRDLIPYARNSRTHSKEQVAQIAASIQEFGWTNPVLVDGNNGVIAGAGRILAAELLGRETVPVIELGHLTDAQKRAYVIADNQLALNAGWDDDILRLELGDLKALDFDLSVIGFGDDELAELLNPGAAGLTEPDAAPEPPAAPVSRPGDLWLCGAHRALCGDATVAGDVERAMGEAKPLLMVTDPPYGVEYDAEWRLRAGLTKPTAAYGKVSNDDRSDWREAWALFPGDVAYVWHAGRHASAVQVSLEAAGLMMRSQIIWAKSRFAIGRGDYHWQHEPLVCRAQGRQRPLERRSQPVDALGDQPHQV